MRGWQSMLVCRRILRSQYDAPPSSIPTHMQNGTCLAAIDIGSNSFRLEIGRYELGHIHRVEYLRETVRQGNGLDEQGNLSRDAMERGWACLARFGERLAGFPPEHVRVVATQTLREARNREEFLTHGSQLLGYPIQVISGLEEARLIYQGVARLLPQSDERRLVIDIGGRSTELIVGQRFSAQSVASYPIGSVAWSQQFFPKGIFVPSAFDAAEAAAKVALADALATFGPGHWDQAYGSSGTARAVGDVLTAAGEPEGIITQEGLDWLLAQLLQAETADQLQLQGVKDDRRAVIGGGISVLRAMFSILKIDHMQVAQGALRQGALFDMLKTEADSPQELRSAGVQGLVQRFDIDRAQAERVATTACTLFQQAAPAGTEQALHELGWVSQLHEIGCVISHTDYHRHGAYILENTDAAGFGVHGLRQLAVLILGQQGKIRKLESNWRNPVVALQLLCLRLAVALCHARRTPDISCISLHHEGRRFALSTRPGWSTAHPLSCYLLREEVQSWQKTNWDLVFDLR
jgi:exopolyphosphatase/guanosine-5'-triphosphate,3'-diphosphate pyrophosphatase